MAGVQLEESNINVLLIDRMAKTARLIGTKGWVYEIGLIFSNSWR